MWFWSGLFHISVVSFGLNHISNKNNNKQNKMSNMYMYARKVLGIDYYLIKYYYYLYV